MRLAQRAIFAALVGLPLLSGLTAQAAEPIKCTLKVEELEPPSAMEPEGPQSDGDACSDFNIAHHFHRLGYYQQAEEWYISAAGKGYSRASFEIAKLYRDGLLPEDDQQRRAWLAQAAHDGLDLAQIELGLEHLKDREITGQLFIAMYWFEKAAVQGNPQAQYLLGQHYWSDQAQAQELGMSSGDELAERYSSDDGKALHWLCKAAQNNEPRAQFSLSQAYSLGRGTPVNQTQRQLWLEKAAANGDESALSQLNENGNSWYTQAEQWLKRQLADETAQCPVEALQLES